MALIINDWYCKKCGYEITDHIYERDSVKYLLCPECHGKMNIIPQFAKPKVEFPQYAQKEAIHTLDPESNDPRDLDVLRKAKNGNLNRDEWRETMSRKQFTHTDQTELNEFRRRREKRRQGETPEEKKKSVDKLLAAHQKNSAITVSATT